MFSILLEHTAHPLHGGEQACPHYSFKTSNLTTLCHVKYKHEDCPSVLSPQSISEEAAAINCFSSTG